EALLEAGRESELRGVLSGFAAAGVPALVIKGAALAYSRYPEPWLRHRNDNDVLVRGDGAKAAGCVLSMLGYQPGANALPGELANHQLPYVKTDRLGFRHVVDLHWKISNRPLFANVLTFDEL